VLIREDPWPEFVVDVPLLSFVAVTLPLVLTPGASTAVVLRNSIGGGTRAGVVTAAGVNTGSLCYGMLTAFGLAAALRRWPTVWNVVHAAGIFYLAWLGVRSLGRAVRPRDGAVSVDPAPRVTVPRSFYEGFLTNLLNPAIATFYLVVLPQFIPGGSPIASSILVLTALHITMAATWHIAWAAAGGTLARVLGSGRPRQILEGIAGIALLGFAIKLALS
jgi:threonine/homoserine/homoserine lactone efflux protein